MTQNLRLTTSCLLSLLAGPALAQTSLGPWAKVPTAPPTTAGYNSAYNIQLPKKDVIWSMCFGNNGHNSQSTFIMASADNGLTWQVEDRVTIDSYSAVDGQEAWAVINNKLYHTTTGVKGFTLAPVQTPVAPSGVLFFTATQGLASTTSASYSHYTLDGGQSWQASTRPALATGDTYKSSTRLDTHLWLATTKGVLLHTPDAGLTWTTATLPESISTLSFRDAKHGLALGSSSTHPLYRTADGGTTWTLLSPTGLRRFTELAAAPGSAGTYLNTGSDFTTGDRNGTSRSTDDGQTWQDLGGGEYLSSVSINQAGQTWGGAAYIRNPENPLRRFADNLLATTPASLTVALPAIYPNPTTGRVQLPAAGAYRAVVVYDALGRPCHTAALGAAETSLDLGGLGAGLYLLRFSGGPAAPQQQQVVVAP